MTLQYIDEYRDKKLADKILEQIYARSEKEISLMEVCGTHTMSIFRHGIRSLLPKNIKLISGPGCPVCVTSLGEINAFIEIAKEKDVILTVFGDMIRVPGSNSSLEKEKAEGYDIRIVYSAFDALLIAKENPNKKIVFVGLGFETTTPTIAATIKMAKEEKVFNFSVFCCHKIVPPALEMLAEHKQIKIDGLILPGHVLAISGTDEYLSFVNKYKIPACVTAFEPLDILYSILLILKQIEANEAKLENAYKRVVSEKGNEKGKKIVDLVFEKKDASWRGIGKIKNSGLQIKHDFEKFDAGKIFNINAKEVPDPKGCICGKILTGLSSPLDCKLYKKLCTPSNPVGPCMVSSEGTCAAFYKYH